MPRSVGNVPQLTNLLVQGGEAAATMTARAASRALRLRSSTARLSTRSTSPLQFWFCRNPGLALPLIALQYHEVRINLEFNDLRNLLLRHHAAVAANLHTIRDRVSAANLTAASLYVDYIYLDTDERRKFAQVSHEYLIETAPVHGR
jgi:hypothetical protein